MICVGRIVWGTRPEGNGVPVEGKHKQRPAPSTPCLTWVLPGEKMETLTL